MGTADSSIDQGGIICLYIRTDLLGVSSISTSVRVRDMGPDTAHKEGDGRILPQGLSQADGEATAEGGGLILPPDGGCDGEGGLAGGGYLRLLPP